ncbi:MAG: hypothetical protein LBB45_03330 [Methanobrevibacter sp.]|jgi:hypothetical protein|nr:hypothetical protein [Candidatus Methanovirga basalitermitum]
MKIADAIYSRLELVQNVLIIEELGSRCGRDSVEDIVDRITYLDFTNMPEFNN